MPEGTFGQETNTGHNIPAGNTLHNPTGETAPRVFDNTHLSEAYAQGLIETPESPKNLKKSKKGLIAGLGGGAVALLTAGAVMLSSGGGKGGNNSHEAGPTPSGTSTSAPETAGSTSGTSSPSSVETQPNGVSNPNFAKDPGITITDIVPVPANTAPNQVINLIEKDLNTVVASGNLQLIDQALPLITDEQGVASMGTYESVKDYLTHSVEDWASAVYNRPQGGYPDTMVTKGPYELHNEFISSTSGVDSLGRKTLQVKATTWLDETDNTGATSIVTPKSEGTSVFTLTKVTLPDGSTESAWVAGGLQK